MTTSVRRSSALLLAALPCLLLACDSKPPADDEAPKVAEAPPQEPVAEKPPEEPPAAAAVTAEVDPPNYDKERIREVVRAQIGDIRGCYNEGLGRNPALAGRVVIGFTITGEGAVKDSAVSQTDLGDPAVEGCMSAAVGGWQFPKSDDGENVQVQYPFVLEPG
ncbi:MAG: AgmX/PglI C-terminal domain-containing protein [Myxococcales bacterium]|nr:AgmX/PglI C-terminal domain-containing protein [Myxococcales bacterium]